MYGLESTDEEVLKKLNKNQTLEDVSNAIAVTKQVGIDVRLAFMIGNPGETLESIDKTFNYVKKMKPDIMVVNIITPYPGTALYNWAVKENLLLTNDWRKYELSNVILKVPDISPDFIEKRYHSLYRKFYLRPSYILNHLKKMRTVTQWYEAFQAFGALMVR